MDKAFDLAAEKIGLGVTTVDPTPCFYVIEATEFVGSVAASAVQAVTGMQKEQNMARVREYL